VQKPKPPAAGKGRPKGAVNKTTKAFKEAMEAAYDHLGGQTNFNAWAKNNQDAFYGTLMPKLIPVQLNHANHEGGSLVIVTGVPRATD